MPSKFHNRKAKIQKQQKLENNQQLKVDTVIIFKTISTEHYADSFNGQHSNTTTYIALLFSSMILNNSLFSPTYSYL